MPASPARAAAYDVLLAVGQRDAFASELLHSEHLRHLSTADHALATEIVMGVLRWQSALDLAIANFSSQKLAKLDPEVLVALRIAAYQIAFTRVPARAAVNESVELVKRAHKRSAMSFVNAVLRKLAAAAPKLAPANDVPVEALAQAYAHPPWLVTRWIATFGEAATRSICQFDQQIPTASLRLASPDVESELRAEGIELAPGSLLTSARRVLNGDVTRTKAFAERRVAIQDEGSQLVAALVGRGLRLLDCCAAPGGKTAILAERNPQAHIVAADIHPHRARLLRDRVGASNVEVLTADAAQLPVGQDFDRVLADVPCSGTGTLAHNPEIKWKLSPDDLGDLHARQAAILSGAMSHVAVGGLLVYSTCSLESEENESVIDEVLRDRHDFRVINVREELEKLQRDGELAWTDLDSMLRGNYLRTIPGIHPCDGFFAGIMERIR